MEGKAATLAFVSVVLLVASVVVAFVAGRPSTGAFPWGVHIVAVPGVLLLGLIVGWVMRDRQAAEERSRQEIAEAEASDKEANG